jgi:hypothetical protein
MLMSWYTAVKALPLRVIDLLWVICGCIPLVISMALAAALASITFIVPL